MSPTTNTNDNTIDALLSEQEVKDNMKAKRLSFMEQEVQGRLQLAVRSAADIRKKIVEAKTPLKVKFYEKKFKKVQSGVMSLLATLEQIKQLQPKQQNDSPTSITDQDSVA
jgi:soluble cytochrome b562